LGSNLSNAILTDATYSSKTKFPKNFDPEKAGMIKKEAEE
jgi:hypothetical protein